MVFNHRLSNSFDSNGNSSFEIPNEGLSYFSGSTTATSAEHNDYQEIDDAGRHCENHQGLDQENEDGSKAPPPPLPPKPKVLPIKPSNWAGNKENHFKVPQELPRSSFV